MKFLPAAALALLAAGPALADQTITLDFETAPSFASIGEHYAALGVSFGPDALGLANDEAGPYFSNAPSPLGVLFTTGADATMNVAAGFRDSVAFSYASTAFVPLAVSVWSGLNGSGKLLASFNLVENAQAGCSDTAYCNFDRVSSTFRGLAHSITFSGDATAAAFDNVTITAVPEPTTVLMMSFGLAGLMLAARRRA